MFADDCQVTELEHTAEIGLQVRAASAPTLFACIAQAMFALVGLTPDTTAAGTPHTVSVTAPDVESLLVDWLSELAYLYDAANGASMQAIPLAHTLAAVREVLGHFGPLDARFVRHYERIQLIDRGGSAPSNTPSQVLAHGLLTSGAALSLHYRGGVSRGTNLLWEINGSEGDIQVTADIGHAQLTQLNIRGARGDQSQMEALMPPAQAYEGLPSAPAARNIARIYAQLALDIRSGSRQAPSFDDAVALHEVVDQLERTAAAHEL